MFRGDFMPRAYNAALEKRESRFHGVCVHVAMNVLLGVIDRLMDFFLHVIECPRIDSGFVCHNHFHVPADVGIDNLAYRVRSRIGRANQAEIAVALPNADYYGLLASCTPAALLAAHIGLINLYGPAQRLGRYVQHGRADAMAEVPRRFVADSKLALHLIRGHALARLTEQVGGKKPLPQGQMGIVEDGLRCYAELMRAIVANKLIARVDAVDLARAALQ